MALRISRPALKEAYERQGKDITEATHQEMRSLVCAQCHVEYYFKGKEEKYLTFPWDDGLTVENFETYFEKTGHVDWINAVSGAKMIKMQHPDFEMYEQGIHAFQGVSCSDCHMPYKSEGGIKFTDHQVQSPLYNIQNSCQVCHKWSETEVKDRVTKIQDNNREMLDRAENSLVRAHMEVGNLSKLGVTDAELEEARRLITVSQLYWDYVAANNGMGFHAPQESARILTKSIDFSKDCLIITATLRATKGLPAFEMPDVTSQEKAKGFITPLVDAQKAAKAAAAKTASVPAEQTTASIVSDDKA
jgi:nitrite reductase (cytochrome c-552)